MCLDSALDLWPPDHLELGFFASQIGHSELEVCSLVSLLGVGNLRSDNSLKLLQISRKSKQTTNNTLGSKIRHYYEELSSVSTFRN